MSHQVTVLLADDDMDDCMLFEDALTEISVDPILSIVNDGEQLIRRLFEGGALPDVLFLDLNMPRRNGFECLIDLMANERTRELPIIIISTSFNPDIARLLHNNGARYYIRKPDEFEMLKTLIGKGLHLVQQKEKISFSEFVLNS